MMAFLDQFYLYVLQMFAQGSSLAPKVEFTAGYTKTHLLSSKNLPFEVKQ